MLAWCGEASRDCPAIVLLFDPCPVQDQLESVLEVLHRQMDQYRDQPQHLEKIAYQQRLLQEDLVHIRAELSRESTVRRGCGGWQTLPPQVVLGRGESLEYQNFCRCLLTVAYLV